MIYTVTLNPSVDYIIKLDSLQIGELNRSTDELMFPGGKGINVTRVLKNLGVMSKALGFIGGYTGKFIEDNLQKEDIEIDFVRVQENTRINIKLKTDKETEINARGPSISIEDVQILKEKVSKLTSEDLLILAGSIPATMPDTIYEELVKICNQTRTQFVVDAEGELLKKVLPFQPFLIKPNHHELGQLFQTTISNSNEVIFYGKKLLEMGAQNVIVSLANKGAMLITKDVSLVANVPTGVVKNSVGAGDSMVAGFIAKFIKTSNLNESFRYSVATGSATAFSLGLCTEEQVEKLLMQVQINEISM
ncbi:1-phosphofructokinase [Neobacillus massiliamazoniensis]|uniref:Tagatose-6-phosphate kinase n=1 Tax=Neobacillus massiliamazoniensis TaxID=1499688 RepID=A0A0U1P0K5_9BACI|nr:1-phosphofructokinase [Neobacillus massiliamazoniensis]CRK83763.1 putative 1-phosphofructokinase [Neobacillus massiliamazoniensis]